MKRVKILLFVLGILLVSAAFAQKPAVVTSNEPGWHKIGEITASFDLDTESIVVLGSDEFDAIKLKVTDAPINIERVQVFYESGEIEDVDLQDELQAGAETRMVDLEHATKDIEKVSFTYQTSANYTGDKAHVELYGFKRGESESYRDDNRAEEQLDEVEQDIDQAAENTEREIEEETDDAERTGEKVKDGFNRSTAVIGAEIKDKVFKDKTGPDGETIYIEETSKYYYIDKDGNKVFITKMEMKDKPKKDDN